MRRGAASSLGLEVSSEDEGVQEENVVVGRREGRARVEDSDSDVGEVRRGDSPGGETGGNDFEMMMARKRAENKRFRKRKDIDVINENDDAIAKMIADMRIAAKEDRDLNMAGLPATKKMAMFEVRQLVVQMSLCVRHNLDSISVLNSQFQAELQHYFLMTLGHFESHHLPGYNRFPFIFGNHICINYLMKVLTDLGSHRPPPPPNRILFP